MNHAVQDKVFAPPVRLCLTDGGRRIREKRKQTNSEPSALGTKVGWFRTHREAARLPSGQPALRHADPSDFLIA
jgi:hypothetical protein